MNGANGNPKNAPSEYIPTPFTPVPVTTVPESIIIAESFPDNNTELGDTVNAPGAVMNVPVSMLASTYVEPGSAFITKLLVNGALEPCIGASIIYWTQKS